MQVGGAVCCAVVGWGVRFFKLSLISLISTFLRAIVVCCGYDSSSHDTDTPSITLTTYFPTSLMQDGRLKRYAAVHSESCRLHSLSTSSDSNSI
jgi:hypothetical protein